MAWPSDDEYQAATERIKARHARNTRRIHIVLRLVQLVCVIAAGVYGGWQAALFVAAWVFSSEVIDKGVDRYFDWRKEHPAKERKWWWHAR